MQIPVHHETLSIAYHVGPHMCFSSSDLNFLGPLEPRALV